jgi:hypothetical protein
MDNALLRRTHMTNKIALWRIVNDAYQTALTNIGWFAKAAGVWLVLLTAGTAIAAFEPPFSPFKAVLPPLLQIGELVGQMLIGLAWLRGVLEDERPQLLPPLGWREARFIGYCLVVAAIIAGVRYFGQTVLVVALTGVAVHQGFLPLPRDGMALFEVSTFVMLLALVSGFLLALPAAAIDEPGDLLGRAWRRARGNRIRLCAAMIACCVPSQGAYLMLTHTVGPAIWDVWRAEYVNRPIVPQPTSLQMFWATEIDFILNFFSTAIVAGFLALAYRQLATGIGGGAAVPAE